jgi:hypothetical protein
MKYEDMSLSYLLVYWQPLSGFFIGPLMVGLYVYLYVNRSTNIVPWIAKHIFRNQMMSEKSADSLFKVITSFLCMFGGLIIILALLYLTH